MWKILVAGILVSSGVNSYSQEMWGISNSNYAGTMGHELNPASIVANPFKWEIHFLSADVSVMNNYMYLQKNSRAIRLGVKGESVNEERFKDKYTTNDKKAFGSAYIKLPALMYSSRKWGLGFHVSTKVGLSATGIPYHLAKFMKEGFDYSPQHQINYSGGNTSLAAMNYHEAGITGGMLLMDDKTSFLTGGVTLNYLYGMNSVYLLINDINYNVQADSLWQIYVANIEYGHSSVDGGDNAADNALSKKGSGFSTSLGVQYYRNRNDAAYNPCFNGKGQKKYDYKIGFSLIDIGKINWKTNAHKYVFEDVSTDWYGIDTLKVNSFSATDSTFNTQFYGLQEAGLVANTYSLFAPAAASMQFDYACTPNIYLNFSVVQRLPLSKYMIKRPNQVSITARYEVKNFEIAIPYSLYDYYRNRIGLAIRYGVLTLGTDMIGPYTGISNAFGVDIYFGIKWQLYQSCERKSAKASKIKGGRAQGCFDDF